MDGPTTISVVSVLCLAAVFAYALKRFFDTKKGGFGEYTTALPILILILFIAAIAFAIRVVDWPTLANLLFAIAGFAGGLLAPKKI